MRRTVSPTKNTGEGASCVFYYRHRYHEISAVDSNSYYTNVVPFTLIYESFLHYGSLSGVLSVDKEIF